MKLVVFIVVSALVVLGLVPSMSLQVSNISCLSTTDFEVHFIVTNSEIEFENDEVVNFVLNDIEYIADYTKHTGNAYHFSSVLTTSVPFTATITEAFIQYTDNDFIYAHNLPYIKYINCNPTQIEINSLKASTYTNNILNILVIGLFITSTILVGIYVTRKPK